jgi:broad specificity phosphatase PhoE
MIVLLRHGMPATDPAADPMTWPLSAAGAVAAASLAPLLPSGAVLVSSDEPKAAQTLRAAAGGRTVPTDPRLREVHRPPEPWSADFRLARQAYVEGRIPAGWERPAAVADRMDAVIATHRRAGVALVVAGHGMAFTVWLARHGLIGDPGAFWAALRFPDLLAVDDAGMRRLS